MGLIARSYINIHSAILMLLKTSFILDQKCTVYLFMSGDWTIIRNEFKFLTIYSSHCDHDGKEKGKEIKYDKIEILSLFKIIM